MSDKDFYELWAEVQGKLGSLRDVPIDDLNIWCVDHNGQGAPHFCRFMPGFLLCYKARKYHCYA